MKKHNLAFIDLETTGFDPEKQDIIELGCIVAEQVPRPGKGADLKIISELELKIQPLNIAAADPEALRINGYNSADWLFAVTLEQALNALNEKAKDCIMIGQNVTFDWQFLQAAYKKTGIKNAMHYHKLDIIPMAFAKHYHDEKLQYFSLKNLADYFGLKNEKAHTALADIRLTFEIYKKLVGI